MNNTAEIEVSFHGARLCVPAHAAVTAWLKDAWEKSAPQSTEDSVANIPGVGEYWEGQGGIYAGFIRAEDSAPGWHLIIPTHPSAMAESIKWGRYNVDVDAKSHTDGLANTRALVALGAEYEAARWAAGLDLEGHSDFYLPARRELALAEVNLSDHFAKGWYWSSTQYSAYGAWYQNFDGGFQHYAGKSLTGRARAVRRLQF